MPALLAPLIRCAAPRRWVLGLAGLAAVAASTAAAQVPFSPAATASSAAPASAPCGGPEHRQLDFWLGRWAVRWDAQAGLPAGSGTNTVTRAYGGCVVQEAFEGGPATAGLVGHSVSSFHVPSGRWRQAWVDNQGGHFALVGGPQGPRFVLVASRLRDGAPVQRMVFEDITEQRLTWRWQASADAGATWSDQWVIHYTRLPVPDAAQAEAMASRLLAAVGGRDAWAALRNTVNDSQQFRAEGPAEVRAVITMDFERPRWRIDTTAPGLRLTRVVDGPADWRLTRDGTLAPLSAATRQDDLQWYAGHVYRTLARLARRDPLLQLKGGDDGRLEVHEGGRRVAWFKLGADGEPYAFGGVGDGPGSICGPWSALEQGIRHPVWVASADGRWRSSLNRLQVNVHLPDDRFQPPPPSPFGSRR